jgi:hypothetical protein
MMKFSKSEISLILYRNDANILVFNSEICDMLHACIS